jgi:MraZ protein
MFVSTYEYSIDDKGRLSIPSKFCDAIEKSGQPMTLYITRDINPKNRVLLAYAQDRYMEIMNNMANRSRDLVRSFTASTQECLIDKQCRVVLPQSLREYAGLKREVSILGTGKNIEIWDRATLLKHESEHQAPPIPDDLLY